LIHRLTWTETNEDESRALCDVEHEILAEIKTMIELFPAWDSGGSKSFASHFRESFRERLDSSWMKAFLLRPMNRRRSSVTNFVVDAARDFFDQKCQHHHQIRIEISFDNRQIIGTNVLKMLVGAGRIVTSRRLGILIAPSKDAKNVFGLDPAVGSSDEYLLAIESGYPELISLPIFLGVIRPD